MSHDTTVEIQSADVHKDRGEIVMVLESPTLTAVTLRNRKVKVTVGDETVTVYAKDLIKAAEKARA